jgi:hypothetical protein
VPSKASNLKRPQVKESIIQGDGIHIVCGTVWNFSIEKWLISAFKFDSFDVCIICIGIFNFFVEYYTAVLNV